mmetsp:Transcript_35053/g.76580  ORF Transcript_35053/g.76580 Transcript_35053/m.76580 type:complete len:81 (+) Transcript_35053:410-652(+)
MQHYEMKEVFDYFDVDKSGTVDAKELIKAFAALDIDLEEDKANEIVTRHKAEGANGIDVESFKKEFLQPLNEVLGKSHID